MERNAWGPVGVNVSSEGGSLAWIGREPPACCPWKRSEYLDALTGLGHQNFRGSGILVNAVCPGWIATDMGGPGGRPVEVGAARVLWAVLLADDGPTGGFFRDGRRLPW